MVAWLNQTLAGWKADLAAAVAAAPNHVSIYDLQVSSSPTHTASGGRVALCRWGLVSNRDFCHVQVISRTRVLIKLIRGSRSYVPLITNPGHTPINGVKGFKL